MKTVFYNKKQVRVFLGNLVGIWVAF